MTLYIDTKPTLEFDHNDRCMTVFGLYDLDKSCSTRGYHPFLTPRHNAHHNMWHSDADPFTGYTKDEAIQACQADYDRRTAERFREVEVPEHFMDEFIYDDGYGHGEEIKKFRDAIYKAMEAQP